MLFSLRGCGPKNYRRNTRVFQIKLFCSGVHILKKIFFHYIDFWIAEGKSLKKKFIFENFNKYLKKEKIVGKVGKKVCQNLNQTFAPETQ